MSEDQGSFQLYLTGHTVLRTELSSNVSKECKHSFRNFLFTEQNHFLSSVVGSKGKTITHCTDRSILSAN